MWGTSRDRPVLAAGASAPPFLSLRATCLRNAFLLLRGWTSQTWQVLAPSGALTLKAGATAMLGLVSHLEAQLQAEPAVGVLSPGGQRGLRALRTESRCSLQTCS